MKKSEQLANMQDERYGLDYSTECTMFYLIEEPLGDLDRHQKGGLKNFKGELKLVSLKLREAIHAYYSGPHRNMITVKHVILDYMRLSLRKSYVLKIFTNKEHLIMASTVVPLVSEFTTYLNRRNDLQTTNRRLVRRIVSSSTLGNAK